MINIIENQNKIFLNLNLTKIIEKKLENILIKKLVLSPVNAEASIVIKNNNPLINESFENLTKAIETNTQLAGRQNFAK